jgi:hypothetical protein
MLNNKQSRNTLQFKTLCTHLTDVIYSSHILILNKLGFTQQRRNYDAQKLWSHILLEARFIHQ